MKYPIAVWMVVLLAAVSVSACGTQTQEVGELQRESRTIQPENAKSVRAHLMMGAGDLKVAGAADGLMEADFAYNVSDWKPKVSYEVAGDTGELSV